MKLEKNNRISMTMNEAGYLFMYAKAGAEPHIMTSRDDPITADWVSFLIKTHNPVAPLIYGKFKKLLGM